jgi:hypothetical protein
LPLVEAIDEARVATAELGFEPAFGEVPLQVGLVVQLDLGLHWEFAQHLWNARSFA